MTTCSECLTELSTVRLADIRPDSPVALHYAGCYNCGKIAEDLFQAETRLASALADVSSYATPQLIADRALEGSELHRRKRIGVWLRRGLFVAGAALVPLALEAVLEDDPPPGTVMTQVVPLLCVSPSHAREIAEGYLSSDHSTIAVSEEARTITLRGLPDEVIGARARIGELDSPDECGIDPVTAGQPRPAPVRK